jgi:glucose/arabinose dehydrogenase
MIDRGSQLVALEVGQPFANHNGGAIRFGPDGMLYLGLGDGGSSGDPSGNGQDLNTLLGKVIRIDVRNASADRPYVVPADNPFVGRSGARGEVWAYGLRNPWRMSFDAATGALWVGDVGQGAVEEISVVTRGGNFGWNVVEGDRCYKPSSGCDRTGFIPPVVVYGQDNGRCSVVGGSVYRGTRVPQITGSYVYGDTCSGEMWAVNAAAPGTPVRIASGVRNMTSFGLDAAGEIVVLSFGQPVRRLAAP